MFMHLELQKSKIHINGRQLNSTNLNDEGLSVHCCLEQRLLREMLAQHD